jgi:hypothetical protein
MKRRAASWFVRSVKTASEITGPHPRNSRSTRLQDGPAFFTALFTWAFDWPVFFASYTSSTYWS